MEEETRWGSDSAETKPEFESDCDSECAASAIASVYLRVKMSKSVILFSIIFEYYTACTR